MKEDTRVEGPFELGIKPKVNQNANSVKEANEKRALKNKEIMEMGAEEAIATG